MSGTLFVVATPVGNMEDVTLRALRVLREVDVIAAEDTRRTARLLAHHAIATPSLSFHQHNIKTRIPQLLARLRSGQNVALVTDAGTPGVSDPGSELVSACIEAEIRIDPIPGASAPLAAAVASGFPLVPLSVFGFPPRRSKDRIGWFADVSSVGHTFTFFESPRRIARTLEEARQTLGVRQIVVARELTKVHQEFIRGTVSAVLDQIRDTRGEFTVVVGPKSAADVSHNQIEGLNGVQSAIDMFYHLTSIGQPRRKALSEAARCFDLPARVLYAAVEKAKDSGK